MRSTTKVHDALMDAMAPGPRYLSELAAYVEEHLDTPVHVRAALTALLSDPNSYDDPRGQPSTGLSRLVQEAVLSDRAIQSHLADPTQPVSRQLIDGSWTAVWREGREATDGASRSFKYDVCISFAGDDRAIAERIANHLAGKETERRVFYDEFEKTKLWGKDLFAYLHDIYSNKSLYCIILFSNKYRQRAWTRHELRAAQMRLLTEGSTSYILPVALDPGAVPDEFSTIGFWSFATGDEERIADAAEEKINDYIGENYLPLDLIVELINHDRAAGAIVDALRSQARGRAKAGDQAAAETFQLLALIVACHSSKLCAPCRAIIDLVLFAEGPIGDAFDEDGRIRVFGDAYIMRWLGHQDPILLSAEGWQEHLDAYMQRLGPADDQDEEP